LLVFNPDQPQEKSGELIAWQHMLDIADADMQLLIDHETELQEEINDDLDVEYEKKVKNKTKSIVVSYKMIGINTYNVFVIDLDTKLIKYWHESYQLWESPVKGFLLDSNDFLILSKEGINMIVLGEKQARVVKDKDGQKRMIHALGSMNFLKIEPTNHIYFACQFYDDRQVCLQEQYNDTDGNTKFDDIFKIKIHEMTLREILLIQSLYGSKKLSDVESLVLDQPNPTIFFKVFLELDMKCLTIHLAFDSRSIKSLLSDQNRQFFDDEFPIFYQNREKRSAIDTALSNNQIKSVDLMIDYIVEYQDSYVYAHLFKYNIVDLLEKGVRMTPLLTSNVLNHVFDYDEWPSTHANTDKMFGAFNESIFRLRKHYGHIFPQLVDPEELVDEDGEPIGPQENAAAKLVRRASQMQDQMEDLVDHHHGEDG